MSFIPKSAYFHRELSMKKTPTNGTGLFTENRNGIELYHLQNTDKDSLSLARKPGMALVLNSHNSAVPVLP